jgi:predicted metal-dependent HD superfamily phosphohydrolase
MSLGLPDWSRAWTELGAASGDTQLHRQLIACWSEGHRRYHTLQHLRECLETFETVRGQATRPGEVAVALWFHDALYDLQRDDNEARSADWARDCVLQAGCAEATALRVHALVMATCHDVMPEDPDAQLLVDVDLSILGAEPARFDESDRQIRAEYAHVPDEDYREARRLILSGFLRRPRIYSTGHFHDALESRARNNLERALARLKR